MDIDTCLRMGQLRDDTRDDRHFQLMQSMGDAVMRHCIHYWIAEDHLTIVPGGRIGIEHGLHIGIEQPFDLGQCVDKLAGQPSGFIIHLSLCADLLAVLAKLESVGNLLREQSHQLFHMHTDIIRADGLVGLSLVEVVREDDALHQRHDLLHLLHRGQRRLYGGHHTRLFLTDFRQQRHIPAQHVVSTFLIHIGCKINAIRANHQIYWKFSSKVEVEGIRRPSVIDGDFVVHLIDW